MGSHYIVIGILKHGSMLGNLPDFNRLPCRLYLIEYLLLPVSSQLDQVVCTLQLGQLHQSEEVASVHSGLLE